MKVVYILASLWALSFIGRQIRKIHLAKKLETENHERKG